MRHLFTLPVALLALAGCDDTSQASSSPAGVPEAGTIQFAPVGWPLEVGDTITNEDRDRISEQFTHMTYYGFGLREVDGVIYKADIRTVDILEPGQHCRETRIGYVYYGHVPIDFFWMHDDWELPPELAGVDVIYTAADAIAKGELHAPRYGPDGRRIRYHPPLPDSVIGVPVRC